YRDVIGHSVTGVAIGIEHYSRMIPRTMSIEERLDLLEDASREKAHLLGMREVPDKLGLTAKTDLDGYYWQQVRAAFRELSDLGGRAVPGRLRPVVAGDRVPAGGRHPVAFAARGLTRIAPPAATRSGEGAGWAHGEG